MHRIRLCSFVSVLLLLLLVSFRLIQANNFQDDEDFDSEPSFTNNNNVNVHITDSDAGDNGGNRPYRRHSSTTTTIVPISTTRLATGQTPSFTSTSRFTNSTWDVLLWPSNVQTQSTQQPTTTSRPQDEQFITDINAIDKTMEENSSFPIDFDQTNKNSSRIAFVQSQIGSRPQTDCPPKGQCSNHDKHQSRLQRRSEPRWKRRLESHGEGRRESHGEGRRESRGEGRRESHGERRPESRFERRPESRWEGRSKSQQQSQVPQTNVDQLLSNPSSVGGNGGDGFVIINVSGGNGGSGGESVVIPRQ